MSKNKLSDRIEYLAEMFDVFECENVDIKVSQLKELGYEVNPISNYSDEVICLLSTKENKKGRTLKKISICDNVFVSAIEADPTDHKIFVQWILNLFSRSIKSDKQEEINFGIRLVVEDLPQANEYLTLFEDHKRKRKFKELAATSYILKHMKDPTDVNQYKSLSQLFDAVDPFIVRNPSDLEKLMLKYVEAGQAMIPVRDRKFTVYVPKTLDSSVIFNEYANWCTVKPNNGMFKSYTTNHKKPNGANSTIYIIINNLFFEGKSKDLYQIHFETNQLKDRRNGANVSIYETVLKDSESVSNFFYEELMPMAKSHNKGLDNNQYLDYLVKFGFADSLFELLDDDTPTIRFMTREIPKLPDMSKFKSLDQIIVTGAKLTELHPSIGDLEKLEMLVLSNNKLTSLPEEIGNLKNLKFLNVIGNPSIEFPESIKYLDKSNGGQLHRLGVKEEEIGEIKYLKLKNLLPQTII